MESEQVARFQFIGGDMSLDFTNTLGNYASADANEYLQSYADLIEWGKQAEIFSAAEVQNLTRLSKQESKQAELVLERGRNLRMNLHRVFSAVAENQKPRETDLAGLNKELQEAMQDAQILIENGEIVWDWPDAPLDAMLRHVARAAAELLTSDKLARLRLCSDEICGWLFLDTSKNQSRRWCKMGDCGNRAKSRRFRAKAP